MSTATSRDRTPIGYERTGSGPAVILVDGALCFRGSSPMQALAPLLADRFTVYTYDRRGRGESGDTPPYAIDREVEDLSAILDIAGGGACLYGVSSGAVLAMLAAERGTTSAAERCAAIAKVALFEPPLYLDDQAPQRKLTQQIAWMIMAGRRADALEHFQSAIGIPQEVIIKQRLLPTRSALEALAHTLVYDTTITVSLPRTRLAGIATPALVIDSEGSSPTLRKLAGEVCDAMPDCQRHSLAGGVHDVPAEELAPVLTEFFAQ
jgi:pimeloyl-ACP methyl ester carboxylesterase